MFSVIIYKKWIIRMMVKITIKPINTGKYTIPNYLLFDYWTLVIVLFFFVIRKPK